MSDAVGRGRSGGYGRSPARPGTAPQRVRGLAARLRGRDSAPAPQRVRGHAARLRGSDRAPAPLKCLT